MKPIAILGSGPAGLLAAHACVEVGQPVSIFSPGEKSEIGGAQFLHHAIPGLTEEEPDATIKYEVVGEEPIYRQKVYGSNPVPFTSWQNIKDGMEQSAWSLPAIYDRLWNFFGGVVTEAVVTPEWMERNADEFKCIISTIPRHALCLSAVGKTLNTHSFFAQQIKVADFCVWNGLGENMVRYDGTDHVSWYRCSNLFGIGSTEWNVRMEPPMPTRILSKPVSHSCDCYPEVIRVGRFGRWQKGILAHDGFTGTLRELNERGIIDIGPKQGSNQ